MRRGVTTIECVLFGISRTVPSPLTQIVPKQRWNFVSTSTYTIAMTTIDRDLSEQEQALLGEAEKDPFVIDACYDFAEEE